ncbi:hypothetical protein D3C75_877500 [compost metagenome]
MDFAEKRRHMVLALAVEYNVFYNNQLFVMLVKGYAQYLRRICGIAGEDFLIHPHHPGRGFLKAFPVYILPDEAQDFPDMVLQLLAVFLYLLISVFSGHRLNSPVLPAAFCVPSNFIYLNFWFFIMFWTLFICCLFRL